MRYYQLYFKEKFLIIKFRLYQIIYSGRFVKDRRKKVKNFFKIYEVYEELNNTMKQILNEIRIITKKHFEKGKLTETEYKLLCVEFDKRDKR